MIRFQRYAAVATVFLFFLGVASSLAAASASIPASRPPSIGLPGPGSVHHGRFVKSVQLDHGEFRVDPAPPGVDPTMPRREAAPEIWASPSVAGVHSGSVLGFGLVSTRIGSPNVPALHAVPAWVGFAWGGVDACPAMRGTASPAAKLPSNGYVAVVVGADAWVSYDARSSICGSHPTGPTISPSEQVLSLAWHRDGPVTHGRIRLAYSLPGCGRDFSIGTSGDRRTVRITVEAVAPDAPLPCPAPVPTTATLVLTPPGGGSVPTVFLHALLGLVRQIQPP